MAKRKKRKNGIRLTKGQKKALKWAKKGNVGLPIIENGVEEVYIAPRKSSNFIKKAWRKAERDGEYLHFESWLRGIPYGLAYMSDPMLYVQNALDQGVPEATDEESAQVLFDAMMGAFVKNWLEGMIETGQRDGNPDDVVYGNELNSFRHGIVTGVKLHEYANGE